jgi:hypothetical protein
MPFCGVWMIIYMLGWKTKVIFHPTILEQLANPIVYHTQSANHFEKSLFFFVEQILRKKTL